MEDPRSGGASGGPWGLFLQHELSSWFSRREGLSAFLRVFFPFVDALECQRKRREMTFIKGKEGRERKK